MPVAYLEKLNSEQRRAVEHGVRENACAPVVPLLVIAGAGSGKTNTLAHRVAGAPGFEPGNGGIKIRCLTTCQRAKARAIGSLFLLAAKLSERRRLRGRHITLVSDQDELAIVPRGDLAAILRFAAGKEKPRHPFGGRVLDALLSQKSVVAGARNRDSCDWSSGQFLDWARVQVSSNRFLIGQWRMVTRR